METFDPVRDRKIKQAAMAKLEAEKAAALAIRKETEKCAEDECLRKEAEFAAQVRKELLQKL